MDSFFVGKISLGDIRRASLAEKEARRLSMNAGIHYKNDDIKVMQYDL